MGGPQSACDACGDQSAAGLLDSSAFYADSDGLRHALPGQRFCSGTRPRGWWVRRRPHGWWTLRWRPRRQLRWICRSSVRGRALRRGSLRRAVHRRSLHWRSPGTVPRPVLLPRLPPLPSRPIFLPPPSRVFRLLRVRPSSCRAVLRVPAVQLLLRPVLRSVLTVLRSELLLLATPRLLTPVGCGDAATACSHRRVARARVLRGSRHAPVRWRAMRSERAMMVSVGLNPPDDTNTEPSAT